MVSLFGNICADNFFDNPYQIINISKKVELKKTRYISGYRSENISDVNENLFNYVNKKIINFIYPGARGIDFRASTYFQKSDADENDGWVHADPGMITAIIYLTPGGTSGTSIFDAKEEFNLPQQPTKHEYFENKEKYTKEGVIWLSIISSAEGKQGYVSPDEAIELTYARSAKPFPRFLIFSENYRFT